MTMTDRTPPLPFPALWAAPVLCALAICAPQPARACTSYLVTKGASADGSTFITYAADSHTLYGDLEVLPGGVHAPGLTIPIHDWDTGKYLGRIPQAPVTYGVTGLMNEHQLAVGETTFGGRKELVDPKGIVDYGSLMRLALQRAKTAREAISVMTSLVETHGYYSEGESFSIADPDEAWILEMVGRGPGGKGALWVAVRVPDGYVSAHANMSRIRQFPLKDPKNAIYSKDVITYAREKGWFKGTDAEFSFADAYYPRGFGGMRFCDSRVWRFFMRVAPGLNLTTDWVKGVVGAKPLPMWVKPERKLSVSDVMELMRDHFEGTEFDLSTGVGAGPFGLPYRWRPLTWTYEGKKHFNERAASTQQTGFSFVTQSRSWLPGPIGGVLWFGVDDTWLTVYVPMYVGIREAPRAYAPGTGTFKQFSWDAAFWVFNAVSNLVYTRWSDMSRDVRDAQAVLEGSFITGVREADAAALQQYQKSPGLARDYLTAFSAAQADRTMTRWRALFPELLMKYLDGNVRDALGEVQHPPYPKDWYRRIVEERPGAFDVTTIPGEITED
jgi:dipeptidase